MLTSLTNFHLLLFLMVHKSYGLFVCQDVFVSLSAFYQFIRSQVQESETELVPGIRHKRKQLVCRKDD